uniref:Uncharacterized protein n=1 Tax=Arundo donax TaxID=35708 RepID=A0A0A9CV96_ARUDO
MINWNWMLFFPLRLLFVEQQKSLPMFKCTPRLRTMMHSKYCKVMMYSQCSQHCETTM